MGHLQKLVCHTTKNAFFFNMQREVFFRSCSGHRHSERIPEGLLCSSALPDSPRRVEGLRVLCYRPFQCYLSLPLRCNGMFNAETILVLRTEFGCIINPNGSKVPQMSLFGREIVS